MCLVSASQCISGTPERSILDPSLPLYILFRFLHTLVEASQQCSPLSGFDNVYNSGAVASAFYKLTGNSDRDLFREVVNEVWPLTLSGYSSPKYRSIVDLVVVAVVWVSILFQGNFLWVCRGARQKRHTDVLAKDYGGGRPVHSSGLLGGGGPRLCRSAEESLVNFPVRPIRFC